MTKRQALGIVLFAVCLAGLFATWLAVLPRDPLFRGKPESEWIKGLVYRDDGQVKQWREFGREGVLVLVRALERASESQESLHQRTHRALRSFLPASVMRLSPSPPADISRSTRMAVVDLLSRLSKDAMAAMPVMTKALNEKDYSVRQIAITFFTAGEDDNCLLNQMEAGEKAKLLPAFIRAAADPNWGVRNNAMVALRFYPEQAVGVVPVLLKAMGDSEQPVRELAADALKRIDPAAAATAGVK